MKKLTAGIFTVLMGLVSVNAADAAVASKGYVDQFVGQNGSITTKVGALETTVGDASSGLVKDVADLQTQLENGQLNINDDAILTDMIKNGQVTEAKLSTELAGKINAKADTSYVNAELAKKENVANKASAITDGMQKDVMYPTVKLTEDLIATSNQDMSDLIGDVADGKTVVEMISDAQDAAEGKVTELANGAVKANTEAIAAINHEQTGILKQAQNYADTAEADAIAAAAADATSKADAAQAAAIAAAGAAADTKLEAYSTTEEMNSAIATATTDMATQTYVVSKANAALDASVGYTDSVVASLKLADIARVPAACGETGKYCVLTTDNTKFVWEVIERSESEAATYNPTGVNVPDVATVSKPAAIAK